MSLVENSMTLCTMLDKTTVSDGRGGFKTVWAEGATIQAAIAFDDSTEARVGEAQGVTSLYSVLTRRFVNLQFHDVFRREEDGKIFRVTSDGDDNKTPTGAGLKYRHVSAEEWKIPAGV